MSELFSPAAVGETQAFTVTELTRAVRGVLEEGFGEVWVEGEVSNYRKQPSGHQYFTLKDDGAQLSCVWFARGQWRRQVPIQDGMQVRARGRLTVYEARGQYQLNVISVEAAGAGLLQARFEAMKRKLQAEGLFDPSRKRSIPRFATTVAVVTSSAGAALRDMLNIFARRAPWLRVIIAGVRVQGDGAAEEVVAALQMLNGYAENGLPKADVIVVARGGGSAEDLWEFNEEIVARAVAASEIPVISAIGHEIDFTICDFAADLRAPTPSAAAEIVAPDGEELSRRIRNLGARVAREAQSQFEAASQRLDYGAESLTRAIRDRLNLLRNWLQQKAAAVREHRPDQVLAMRRLHVVRLSEDLQKCFRVAFDRRKQRLERVADHLRLLSPDSILQRGYSITTDANGRLITAAADVTSGEKVITKLASGELRSVVE